VALLIAMAVTDIVDNVIAEDPTCTPGLLDTCSVCCEATGDAAASLDYNCSLPGLDHFEAGAFEGVQVNYLSYVTETSSPNLPLRADEFTACTGGTIVFSEANNVFEDPVLDLGTKTSRGSEIYDGYFMSYSHFPEVSQLGLAEHLNDRIRKDNALLKWEDVLPKVRQMGEYRKDGVTNIDFLMYDGDFFVPLIRLDLLEKHNLPLPNTWDEVVEYAKFFNGTDLNDDGDADDFGFCHFPRFGAGAWDWWWPEAMYSIWATMDQTHGTDQGFFFDEETLEPRIGPGFERASEIWKDLWNHGADGCISPNFARGRCAIGFAPPGCWKGIFLNGISRRDANGTLLWEPKMADGSYATPYRFKPYGSLEILDRETNELVPCTKKLCPKAEPIPARGHWGDDDRASILPPTSLEGQLANRAPYYWSGGLGTLIRKSSPEVKKDMMWDFFVYTNAPETSAYDVASYASWLDSWRLSQLESADNFFNAGWSPDAYQEHHDVMQWALDKDSNGAYNLRLPGSALYTRDVVGNAMNKYTAGEIELDELLEEVKLGWQEIIDENGKLDQLEIYRSSLGLDALSEVEMCRLHRLLMDERDPNTCVKYDPNSQSKLVVVLVPTIVFALLLACAIWAYISIVHNSVWEVKLDELEFGDVPKVIGQGSFGMVLLAEYRGTKVAVKKVIPPEEKEKSQPRIEFNTGKEGVILRTIQGDTEMAVGDVNPGLRSMGVQKTLILSGSGSPRRISLRDLSVQSSQDRSSKGKSAAQVLRLRNRKHEKMKREFVEEMRQLAKLRHPNITTTMGAVLSRTEPMLVMEYMHNGSLYDAMRNDTINLTSKEDILIIVQDIAQGMRFLHAADPQVIHGDLKTKNVLIDANFRAKVADFGLSAKALDGARGTPYWMAPEILTETTHNSVMSDVYAFGILLYEVYSRKTPYEGEDFETVLNRVCNPAVCYRPPVPSMCPPAVAALMKNCLRHNKEDRLTMKFIDSVLQEEGTVQGRVFRIEALNRDLSEKNREISSEQAKQLQYFACMSHEIRTPLNCVVGLSSLLQVDDALNMEQMDTVQMIVASSKLLKQVIDDVLDFSKFISGNAEINISRTNLQELLSNIIGSMAVSPITERKEISLRSFYDPLIPQYIETDGRRLQQIMYNLLSNAVKFSNENSDVDLSVSIEYDDHNAKKESKPKLSLHVTDYGKGIDKSEFTKIFQPFAQTMAGVQNVDGGTGLGLAITKQLVELLGGSISVDSEFGKWTKFSLQLPLTVSIVDPNAVFSRLSNCDLWLVSNDDSQIQYMMAAGEKFGVKLNHFDTLEQLDENLVHSDRDRISICIIQERFYDEVIYNRISARATTFLVTFGTEGGVDRGQVHYKDLTRMFPSVMMHELGSMCEFAGIVRKRHEANKDESKKTEVRFDGVKILVAEDNKVNQKVMVRLLKKLGIEDVKVANNGKVALELEDQEAFDIILMDMQMPEMDGLEACRTIVSRRNAPPKIVFLSAHAAEDFKAICIENGATDYLMKPCSLDDLRGMLQKIWAF